MAVNENTRPIRPHTEFRARGAKTPPIIDVEVGGEWQAKPSGEDGDKLRAAYERSFSPSADRSPSGKMGSPYGRPGAHSVVHVPFLSVGFSHLEVMAKLYEGLKPYVEALQVVNPAISYRNNAESGKLEEVKVMIQPKAGIVYDLTYKQPIDPQAIVDDILLFGRVKE